MQSHPATPAPTKSKIDDFGFKVTRPCPKCGKKLIQGFYFMTEDGSHMHTYYVCRYWESGVGKAEDGGYKMTERCGWEGWSVPGWNPP